MKKKLLVLVGWAGFLAAAIAEYGFDLDFPLTPPVWLAIVLCAVLIATAHTTISSRIYGSAEWETGAGLISNGDKFTDNRVSPRISNPSADHRPSVNSRSRNIFPNDFSVTGNGHVRMSLSGVIVTASGVMPAIIFLNPTTIRGPPSGDNQIADTLDRPARHFCTAPPLFATLFPSSSSFDLNPTKGESA